MCFLEKQYRFINLPLRSLRLCESIAGWALPTVVAMVGKAHPTCFVDSKI